MIKSFTKADGAVRQLTLTYLEIDLEIMGINEVGRTHREITL